MKNSLKILTLIAILFISACGSDDTPSIVPMPSFTQDRMFSEPGQEVTFTNGSTDATSYSWDFGDNTTASTDQSPTHTFSSVGVFTITLSATSSSGDVATSTSTITIGNRYAVALAITSLSFTNANGGAWDPDGSGPELLFGFFPTGQATFDPFQIGDDLAEDDLPFQGAIALASQIAFSDASWTFAFIDNDDPFTDPNTSDAMAVFDINPVTIASEINYENGQGEFEFTSGDYSFIIAFDIR